MPETPDISQNQPNPAASPAAAPDLSALATAGPNAAPPVPVSSPEQAQEAAFMAKSNAAFQAANEAAQKSTAPPPPGPHARLMAMIQGLSVGLGAFAGSAATQGKEGGPEEVQRFQAEKQRQGIQAQQARDAQRNEEVKQQLIMGDTNQKMAQNIHYLAAIPLETMAEHLKVQEGALDVVGKTQDIRTKALQDFIMTGDTAAYNDTLSKTGSSSTTPAARGTAGAIPPAAISTWKNSTDSALSAYPNDDVIQQYSRVLADPKSTPQQMAMAANGAKNRMAALDVGTASRTKQEAAAAGARPKDLNDATGRLTQATQAYKANPTPENQKAVDDATDAQKSFLDADSRQKQIAQDVQNGDPDVIGKAMASGVYAPSQVLSARSMSKPFYSKVVAAANEYAKANGSPEILGPHGEHTGEYFNAANADGQFKYATNVQTQNTLNKILTLNQPGGDLDILKDATTGLPKLDSKTINKIFNAGATEFGSPAATNYHMALYNMASLMAQVQTGGIPTEGEIQQQLGLMSAAYSKGQLDGALQIARRDIAARGTSMVANNPYLRNQYPDIMKLGQDQAAGGAASSGKAVSLKAAMALPINQGKTEDQVRADITAHGHQVGQ